MEASQLKGALSPIVALIRGFPLARSAGPEPESFP